MARYLSARSSISGDELEARGVVHRRGAKELVHRSRLDPWGVAHEILPTAPVMVEVQPIRPVAGGRSFASSLGAAPLHTDSQLFRGAPPDLQIMFCERPDAFGGGVMQFVDGWQVLGTLEREERSHLDELFSHERHMPFVFGDVVGPTVGLAGAGLALTHPPTPREGDDVGHSFARFVARAPRLELQPQAGDFVVADNRRMLHGRSSFRDESRAFVRLLVWVSRPLSRHSRFEARAREVAEQRGAAPRLTRRPSSFAPVARAPKGASEHEAVLAMMCGVPPGVVARRLDVNEWQLYEWRDAALDRGASPLSAATPQPARFTSRETT